MRPDRLTELRNISIEAQSPTGAVIARTAGRGLPRVEIMGAALTEHSEDSLAAEIEETIAEAMEAHREEIEAVTDGRLRKEYVARTEDLPRETRERERLGLNAIREVEATGTSPGGYVIARAFGDGDLVIAFNNNPLRRKEVTIDVLTNEINEAIETASRAFSEKAAESLTNLNAKA
ncbi:hypothetical protein FB566_1859 [Stackebrandtia endophytica]|uniref:Uncharacterized protein n=1 Tax=Stackebrandtia endophytica TaxID=1496996 RepID=A0A543AUS6_9ACTN|nr:YbaB/EbfC family nucleoid-associated protein [Stackebrandtia endophytica]TQL76332.1 hypothetical protein FB566_1859 [Stackebrandtia endophytica]